MRKSFFILFFVTAMIYGCQSDQNSDQKTDQAMNQTEKSAKSGKKQADITEIYWKLVSLKGERVPMQEDQKEAHIILKSEGQKLTGSGGCNVLNGTYEIENENSISFSKIATTMMSCPDMKTERQFLKVLENVSTYQLKADTLVLNSSHKEGQAILVSAPDKKE